MTVSIDDLTTNVATTDNVVTGDGVFDDLMEAVNTHLEAQFQKGRITGTDYATVYLGAIQSVIQQSVSFAIGQEKTNAEVALIDEQIIETQEKVDLLQSQDLEVVANTSRQDTLSTRQALKIDAETAMLEQKEITEYAQTQVTTQTAPDADSILGRQATLFEEQAKGFKWNADQKYLKTLLDAWAINTSTAGAADTSVSEIMGTTLNATIQDSQPTV